MCVRRSNKSKQCKPAMHLVAKGKPWFLAMPGPIDSEISPWQGVSGLVMFLSESPWAADFLISAQNGFSS